ncbi:SH3 domain-containing protein [Roseibium sp. HPY-6]|uniref:SH3 domain-containing protein n=1 Tax=Roseibium sp. HPY-6 TaxID=3229852 RepID=UPI00339042C8
MLCAKQAIRQMTKGLALAALFMAFPLSSNAQPASGEGFREVRVAPGTAVADDLIDVVLPFLKGHPERDEGNGGMQLNIRKDSGGYLVNIILTGYLDDVLHGEHFRGVVIPLPDDRWELLSMSVKPLCARGQNIDGVCQSTPASERTMASDVTPAGPGMCVDVPLDDTLNLRAGPGTRHHVVGSLAPGTCSVELFDICEGNWCQVRWAQISGWVNTRYLAPMN